MKVIAEKRTDHRGYVRLIDLHGCNKSEKARKEFVANLAAVSRGAYGAEEPLDLFDKLIKWGHESVLEFIRLRWPWGIRESWRNNQEEIFDDSDAHDDSRTRNVFLFEIYTPIFVLRQTFRHRMQSMIERSLRYTSHAKVPFKFYYPSKVSWLSNLLTWCINRLSVLAYKFKVNALKEAPEDARICCGVNQYSHTFVMMEYDFLMNFLYFREAESAQWNTREVANAMHQLVAEYLGEEIIPAPIKCDEHYDRYEYFSPSMSKDILKEKITNPAMLYLALDYIDPAHKIPSVDVAKNALYKFYSVRYYLNDEKAYVSQEFFDRDRLDKEFNGDMNDYMNGPCISGEVEADYIPVNTSTYESEGADIAMYALPHEYMNGIIEDLMNDDQFVSTLNKRIGNLCLSLEKGLIVGS